MRCEKFFLGLGEGFLFVFCGLLWFLRLFRVLFLCFWREVSCWLA